MSSLTYRVPTNNDGSLRADVYSVMDMMKLRGEKSVRLNVHRSADWREGSVLFYGLSGDPAALDASLRKSDPLVMGRFTLTSVDQVS